jgi:hypothetical protein
MERRGRRRKRCIAGAFRLDPHGDFLTCRAVVRAEHPRLAARAEGLAEFVTARDDHRARSCGLNLRQEEHEGHERELLLGKFSFLFLMFLLSICGWSRP